MFANLGGDYDVILIFYNDCVCFIYGSIVLLEMKEWD